MSDKETIIMFPTALNAVAMPGEGERGRVKFEACEYSEPLEGKSQ